ncbi:hypothetical protein TEPIDINF_002083 [Tepidibacillus infernus]|uniref:hypothetical protein n=1 Tax=Tepidibacillus infernus TaxID=1806172 RepID=UPI003B7227D8
MIRASYFIYKPNQETDLILSQLGYVARKLWNVANLPSQSAHEVLKVLQEAWESFFELKKSGDIENPKPPRFKQTKFNVKFLNNGFRVEENRLRLSIPKQLKKYLREKYGIEQKFVYIPVPKHIELGIIKTVEGKSLSKGEYKIILAQEYNDIPIKKTSTKLWQLTSELPMP